MKRILPLLIFPMLLIAGILITRKPTPAIYDAPIRIAYASLRDTMPENSFAALAIYELNGLRLLNVEQKTSFLFEYETNHYQLLSIIGTLPFPIDAVRSDIGCRQVFVEETGLELYKKTLQADQLAASDFFWDINHDAFTIYECIKTPFKHTLFLSKESERVFHKVDII